MSDGTYIRFVPGPDRPKTKTWRVVTIDGGSPLGTVEWYAGWRKYQFYPAPGTGYEQVCLREIAAFLEDQTARHYARLREQRYGQLTMEVTP